MKMQLLMDPTNNIQKIRKISTKRLKKELRPLPRSLTFMIFIILILIYWSISGSQQPVRIRMQGNEKFPGFVLTTRNPL